MSNPAASVVPSSQVTRSTADENGDEPTVIQVSSEAASLLAALPPLQRNVLLRLANGASIAQAACGCNVCRMTVYRWIKKPGPFQAAYDRWRQELVESSQARLLQLLDDWVDAVQSAILDGNIDVALELLKTMGALKKPKLGPIAPETDETNKTPGDENETRRDENLTESRKSRQEGHAPKSLRHRGEAIILNRMNETNEAI